MILVNNLHFLSSVPVFHRRNTFEKYPWSRFVETRSMCIGVSFSHEHMSAYSAFLELVVNNLFFIS